MRNGKGIKNDFSKSGKEIVKEQNQPSISYMLLTPSGLLGRGIKNIEEEMKRKRSIKIQSANKT